ncbi:exosortase A [Novosphingobium lentum]|uniref:exosortase A n=1 Tax=Novosphingobium lentum TaxID=145287 RepID=UPI0034E1C95A
MTDDRGSGWRSAIPQAWHKPLMLVGITWLGLLIAFASDWRDMVDQWWNSSTYNHVLLIPPIIGWLVVQRWRQLAQLAPAIWWPGLVWFAGAAFLWVLGDFAGLSLARQLAVVAMLQGVVLTLLGVRVSAGLLFPLFYMLFLVPAGDELIPGLQTVTARLTMNLLGWSHVKASIDGVFITTPAGYFEVAEACSGVKFLIAMIAYGALVANVCFRTWPRRIGFMALCFLVPILANGVRAWGTIFIAQYRGIAFASGFDHIFYGWVFFAIVMAVVMAIGWRFFDRAVDDPMIDAARLSASPVLDRLTSFGLGGPAAMAGLVAIVIAAITWGDSEDRLRAPLPSQIFLADVAGWSQVNYAPAYPWQPLHGGADHRLLGRYRGPQGQLVDVSYALYARQDEGSEAGGFGQGAVPLGGRWAWTSPGPAVPGAVSDRIQAPGPVSRIAVTFYHSGALLTGSNAKLKLATMRDRLLLQARPTSTLIVSAEERPGAPAAAAIAAFLQSTGPVARWMDRLGSNR